MEVGEPEEGSRYEERLYPTEAWLQQILENAAKKQFFRDGGEKEGDQQASGDMADQGMSGDEVDKV